MQEIEPRPKEYSQIQLPSKVILTSDGVQFFVRSGIAVKKMKNREGVLKEGIENPTFNATSIQKLVMNSYIEEIFVASPELLRKRKQLIDTNNLVLYGILYKKLSPSLAEMIISSSVLQDFNRKNPKARITDLKYIDKAKIDAIRQAKKDDFEKMESEVKVEVIRRIENNPDLTNEDRFIRKRSLDKFLAYIDKKIWYLFFVIYQSPLRPEMVHSFADMIALYLDRTKIAIHLSNLLMEFIQNAEKAHFERMIVKQNLAPKEEVDKFLKNGENRKLVTDEAVRKNQLLEIAWSMNSEHTSNSFRTQIVISNYGLISDKSRSTLMQKMKSDVAGIPVSSFFQESSEEEKLGAGLGLLYISYLDEICKKEGIKFSCTIFPEPTKEKTTVKVDITL